MVFGGRGGVVGGVVGTGWGWRGGRGVVGVVVVVVGEGVAGGVVVGGAVVEGGELVRVRCRLVWVWWREGGIGMVA